MHLIFFLEKIKCKTGAVDPTQVPAVTRAGLPDSLPCVQHSSCNSAVPVLQSRISLCQVSDPGLLVLGTKSRTDLMNAKCLPTPLASTALLPRSLPGDSNACLVFLVILLLISG